MADRAKAPAAATEPRPTQSSPDREPEERTFTHEQLLEGPKLAGASSRHEIAGALAGSSRKTFTAEQAAKAVEAFRKHRDDTARESEDEE